MSERVGVCVRVCVWVVRVHVLGQWRREASLAVRLEGRHIPLK